MSREIKFRVFIDYKIFYQDKYDEYGDNLTSIDICKKTITITGFHNYENVYKFEDEKVKLMQYTGLKDKNGKEIYEGDILFSVNENGVFLQEIGFGGDEREYTEFLDGFKIANGYALEYDVVFSELKEFTKNIVLKNNIPYENDGVDDFLYDGWWIIGNIYENKNLLEENN